MVVREAALGSNRITVVLGWLQVLDGPVSSNPCPNQCFFQVGSERVDGEAIHFLVQEFVKGVTLKALLEETGSLDDHFLRKIAFQIAEA